MGQINDIVAGHVNELLGKNEEMAEERMKICKECGLYKETMMGPICNPNLYLNMEDKSTVSDRPIIGYKKGCGCKLDRRVYVTYSHCACGKW